MFLLIFSTFNVIILSQEVIIMNERIKKIRKAIGLTQQEFADSIKVKRNTVATYEMGRSIPSDAAISLICKQFDVNEEWLRSGTGEMFIEKTEDEEISEMLADIQLSGSGSFKHRLAVALARLDDDGWKWLEEFVNSIAQQSDD